jgi:hypothetical protein
MNKKGEKSVHIAKLDNQFPRNEELGHSTTAKISQDTFIGEIPIKRRAYLEITGLGDKSNVIELEEGEVIIGRDPECGIQLSISNVSRQQTRIIF